MNNNNLTKNQQPLVLIVDDDIFVRGMLQTLLEKEEYRVIIATDGINALEMFQKHKPDVILMDAVMPLMDGFKACGKLKKLTSASDTPVIMVTSLDDEKSVNKAFEVGAVEYITKPVHWAVLRHRMAVILETLSIQAALIKNEAQFRGIFEQAAIGIALLDMDGKLIDSNPIVQKMLKVTINDIRNQSFNQFFHPPEVLIEEEFYQQLLAGTRYYYQMEKFFIQKQGSKLWVRITTSLVRDKKNIPLFFVQMIEDITENKHTQTSLKLAAKVFKSTTNSVIITDSQGKLIDANQAFLRTTGYEYEEVLNKNPRFLKSGHQDDKFYQKMWDLITQTGYWDGEIINCRKNGDIYSIWTAISSIKNEHNEVTNYVAVYSDIHLPPKDQQSMQQFTHYDTLTKLPNNLLFQKHLTHAYYQNKGLAVFCLVLDNFKLINKNFSFGIGNQVLKIITQRLKQSIRDNDTLARLKNDKFAIILTPIYQDNEIYMIADKIFTHLTEPISIGENIFKVNCYIGICLCTDIKIDNDKEVKILLEYAEQAVKMAKKRGKNTYHVYNS
ncbi:MAG: PAS domain S-box protein [Thiomargarita sp.]|nr:PAS domain S-box protein [Thiomargarita sp.]